MKFNFWKNDSNEITAAMSFKCTCILNAISKESALIYLALSEFCSYENLIGLEFYFSQNDQCEIHTSFIFNLPEFMRTQGKS